MKSKARFLPFVLALALLTSLFVLSPATAATGSVTLDKSHIKAPDGTVGITVNDPGANFGTVVQNEAEGQDPRGAGGTVSYTIPARSYTPDSVLRYRTQRAPIESASEKELYPDGDGSSTDSAISVDYRDVILRFEDTTATTTDAVMPAWEALTSPSGVDGDRHPFSLENAQGGAFILRTDTAVELSNDITFSVTYKAPDVQMQTVKVTSTQDLAGISVYVTETGADTGVFEGSFTTADSSDAANGSIAAIAGSIITATYEDPGGDESRDRVAVENTAPSVELISPDDEHATQIRGLRVTAQVTDTEAGVVPGSIQFNVTGTDVGTGSPEPTVGIAPESQTNIAIDGGYRSEAQLHGIPAGVTEINWSVSAEDAAGNAVTSDAWSIRVDTVAPALLSAVTGQHLDGDGNVVTDAAKGMNTSVRVTFDEEVNGDSVEAADFRVNDIIPADAAAKGDSVFLTVGAMASDATPTVKVVGAVTDMAGNTSSGALAVTATDGLAPALTAEVSPSYTTKESEIRLRSDESLLTVPNLSVSGGTLSRLRLIADDHYMATFSASDSGVYTVSATGTDTSANESNIGDDVKIEVDNSLPAPTSITLPGYGAIESDKVTDDPYAITTQNPFITIEWDSEASEYDGDSHGAVDVMDLWFGEHGVTTPTGDSTGERTESGDVVFNVTKPSSNRLLISARGLALGEYTIAFNGSDDLGNDLDEHFKITIKVDEPAPFEISLTPGWNLVSLPAEPQSSAINDVIPADHAASIVLTYDPTQDGAWLSASRGSDGSFAGSLENISARTAYWIFTDAFDSLSVPVMQQRGGAPVNLPTVNLVAGWNLLPVLDVSGDSSFGDDATSIGNYVSGVVRTYAYDSSNDRFSQHTGMLQIGSGYWVYLSSATVLVP